MRCLMTRTPYQAEPPLVQLLFNISTLHNCVTTIATLQSLGWFSGQAPATGLLGLQSIEVQRNRVYALTEGHESSWAI